MAVSKSADFLLAALQNCSLSPTRRRHGTPALPGLQELDPQSPQAALDKAVVRRTLFSSKTDSNQMSQGWTSPGALHWPGSPEQQGPGSGSCWGEMHDDVFCCILERLSPQEVSLQLLHAEVVTGVLGICSVPKIKAYEPLAGCNTPPVSLQTAAP